LNGAFGLALCVVPPILGIIIVHPVGNPESEIGKLAVIKELGGVKKFGDLAEAMTATGTDEASP
jgi:hypothetical protein